MDEEIKQSLSPSFIEVESVEEANSIPMGIYRFERFSESRNKYIFVKRIRNMME